MQKNIIRCQEMISVIYNEFFIRNIFKGEHPSCILNLIVLNGRHRQFDFLKRPSFLITSAYDVSSKYLSSGVKLIYTFRELKDNRLNI